eukprot:g18511.t2
MVQLEQSFPSGGLPVGSTAMMAWALWWPPRPRRRPSESPKIKACRVALASYMRFLEALEHDMLSLVFTNSSPALPPFGGARALLGASPFAAGAPANLAHPLVLDMSTTVIARGKLRLMAQRGEPIPPEVGLDQQGRPTRDGMEAFHGVTLPFGGAKGAAIALLMDLLSGLFTGAAFGGRVRSLYNDVAGVQEGLGEGGVSRHGGHWTGELGAVT